MGRAAIFCLKSQIGKKQSAGALVVGKRYCCAINCSNNASSVDPRTGRPVRMHGFPDQLREKERFVIHRATFSFTYRTESFHFHYNRPNFAGSETSVFFLVLLLYYQINRDLRSAIVGLDGSVILNLHIMDHYLHYLFFIKTSDSTITVYVHL